MSTSTKRNRSDAEEQEQEQERQPGKRVRFSTLDAEVFRLLPVREYCSYSQRQAARAAAQHAAAPLVLEAPALPEPMSPLLNTGCTAADTDAVVAALMRDDDCHSLKPVTQQELLGPAQQQQQAGAAAQQQAGSLTSLMEELHLESPPTLQRLLL